MSGTDGDADGDHATGPGDPALVEIIAGGEPSPEEIAALVIALTPVPPADGGAEVAGGPAAWHRAALLEGIGNAAPIHSAADLAGRRTSL